MPWFATIYRADGTAPPDPRFHVFTGCYGGHLFANSKAHARRLLKRRGLNERLFLLWGPSRTKPYVLPSEWLAKRHRKESEVFHALCWMAHLAMKSGAATVDELLGDQGLLHEYGHMRNGHMRNGSAGLRRKLIAMARDIERRIPGMTAAA